MVAASMSLTKPTTFQGLRASTSLRSAQPAKTALVVSRNRRTSVTTHAGFIGSPNNLIIVGSTVAFLVAGRFGLAPTAKRGATPGLKLVEDPDASGLQTGDPSGFTAVDVLGHGTLGHIVGVGIILGLKAIGQLPSS